jgi:hypothetical protein
MPFTRRDCAGTALAAQVQFFAMAAGYDRSPVTAIVSMLTKITVIVLLLAIVATLFSSVFFLVKDDSGKRRTLALLKLRVALSLTLIAFVILAYLMGWIHPHPGPSLH